MALKEDLQTAVTDIFKYSWTERDGHGVPMPEDLRLGNDAMKLEGTVLYADMAGSTELVDAQVPSFAAEIYKAYLACAARIIKSEGGTITAYDGDRIMALFLGDYRNTTAARTALKINYTVAELINPALSKQYPNKTYKVAHRVGIDTSALYVARIGVRNDNDLVWVGRAANYAAKLCAIHEDNATFITDAVFQKLHASLKFGGDNNQPMWRERTWTQMNNQRIHSSTWWRRI